MTPKKKQSDNPIDGAPPRPKRNKKTLTLTQKVTILNMMAKGEGSTSVARALGLSEATVRSVKKNEEKIRRSVAAGAPKNAKLSYYTRDTALQKTEKILIEWIDDQTQKGSPVVGTTIRKEAKRIYDLIKLEELANNEIRPGDKPTTFVASKGWYEKFKKRYTAYASMPDEPVYAYTEPYIENGQGDMDHDYDDGYNDDRDDGEPVPVNPKSAKRFPMELNKIIEEKGYRPEQIFNADETGLYWKKMPKRTFLYEEDQYSQGYKVSKDRMSLILCGNASGDFMVKPLIVYRLQNPMAFKGKNRHQLSVMWRSNNKARVTTEDFLDWFHNCFVHEVRAYLASKNLPFKALLVLDTGTSHPVSLQDEHSCVKVVFLPSGTAPSLQPLDQGVIAAIKACYTRRMFNHLVDAKKMDPCVNLSECWWDYSLADFVKNLTQALYEVKPSAMNACWHNLWCQGVEEFGGFPDVRSEIEAIVDLSHYIGGNGFKDLLEMEVEELLESHREELREEDLREFADAAVIEDEENIVLETPKSQLTTECLEKGFKLAKELQNVLFSIDPYMERCFRMEKKIETALVPYREMFREIHSKRENKMKPTLKKKSKKRSSHVLRGPFPGFFDA